MFVFNKLNRFICIRLSNANKIQTINPEIMNKTTRLLGSLLIITIPSIKCPQQKLWMVRETFG